MANKIYKIKARLKRVHISHPKWNEWTELYLLFLFTPQIDARCRELNYILAIISNSQSVWMFDECMKICYIQTHEVSMGLCARWWVECMNK